MAKSGLGGGKIDHGAKTLYVYLLTSSILYKNTAYFEGGGQYDVFARTIYDWVGNRTPCPPGSMPLRTDIDKK